MYSFNELRISVSSICGFELLNLNTSVGETDMHGVHEKSAVSCGLTICITMRCILMEEEIAAILMTFVRSIVEQASAESILHRVHILRNAIVMRMDWQTLHCPIQVCNYMLSLLRRELLGERRRMMAVVCDLVFSTIIGHNAFFTHFINFTDGPGAAYWNMVPRGPADDDGAAV